MVHTILHVEQCGDFNRYRYITLDVSFMMHGQGHILLCYNMAKIYLKLQNKSQPTDMTTMDYGYKHCTIQSHSPEFAHKHLFEISHTLYKQTLYLCSLQSNSSV